MTCCIKKAQTLRKIPLVLLVEQSTRLELGLPKNRITKKGRLERREIAGEKMGMKDVTILGANPTAGRVPGLR
jgi:hypothetical protein